MSGASTLRDPDYCLSKAAEQELKSLDMHRSKAEREAFKDSANRWFNQAINSK